MACSKRLKLSDGQYSNLFDRLMNIYFNEDKALEIYINLNGDESKIDQLEGLDLNYDKIEYDSKKRSLFNTNRLVETEDGVVTNVYLKNNSRIPSMSFNRLVQLYNGNSELAFKEYTQNSDLYDYSDELELTNKIKYNCL